MPHGDDLTGTRKDVNQTGILLDANSISNIVPIPAFIESPMPNLLPGKMDDFENTGAAKRGVRAEHAWR